MRYLIQTQSYLGTFQALSNLHTSFIRIFVCTVMISANVSHSIKLHELSIFCFVCFRLGLTLYSTEIQLYTYSSVP